MFKDVERISRDLFMVISPIHFEEQMKNMKNLIHYSAVSVTVALGRPRTMRSEASEKYVPVYKPNLC
jgi:hypothetical protein